MPAKLTFKYQLKPGARELKPKPEGPIYPLIRIRLYNEKGETRTFEGLLDSGADGLFLPHWLAEFFNLPKLEKIETSGVLKSGTCYKTKVGFMIGTSKKHRVDFGFVDAAFPETNNDIPILIGRDPLFRFFEVTFKEFASKPIITIEQKVDFK